MDRYSRDRRVIAPLMRSALNHARLTGDSAMTMAVHARRAALTLFAISVTICTGQDARAATLPAGFSESMITGTISNGTNMEFAPDGKLFILEQAGTCEVYEGSGAGLWTQLESNFFADTPLSVDSFFERGLLGIAFDPDYGKNRFVYVYYTNTATPRRNVIERYTANAAGSRALAGSKATIMELDPLSAGNHNGGSILFGPDGRLYAGVGENANSSNAQSLDNRLGKILRLNADPKNPIPAHNPSSFDGLAGSTTGDNRVIWAVGLRNPYTFAFKPGSGEFYINDVGAGTFEEINVGEAGKNYGWPTTEGPFNQASFPNFTHPIVAYHHSNSNLSVPPLAGFTGNVITGAAFYVTDNFIFPLDYAGDYFFADAGASWIKRYDEATNTVINFATSAGGPVAIKVGPDGALYYLARNTGRVFRIVPNPAVCFADIVTNKTFEPPPDGQVDGADLAYMLSEWGPTGVAGSLADLVTNATFQPPPDAQVDGADLGFLLGSWGDCP